MNRWIRESRNQWIKKLTKQWINQTIKITHLLKTIIEYVLTWTSIWSRFQPYWWRIGLRTSSTSLVCLAFTPIDFLEGNSSLQYIYNYLLYLPNSSLEYTIIYYIFKLQPEVYNYLLYLPNSSLKYTIIYYIFQTPAWCIQLFTISFNLPLLYFILPDLLLPSLPCLILFPPFLVPSLFLSPFLSLFLSLPSPLLGFINTPESQDK